MALINGHEPAMRRLSDAQLRAKTEEFRERLVRLGAHLTLCCFLACAVGHSPALSWAAAGQDGGVPGAAGTAGRIRDRGVWACFELPCVIARNRGPRRSSSGSPSEDALLPEDFAVVPTSDRPPPP